MAPPFRPRSRETPPPVPADADIAWSSDHALWGALRRAAWCDGRLLDLDDGQMKEWRVEPTRVQTVIEALAAERFWEWTTQGMPVPDEVEYQLRVRTAEGVREVSLWAHDWRSGRAARCQDLVDRLFELAPDPAS